jgi:signal peptidase I
MKKNIIAAFTALPTCLATYVALIGMAWLLAFGWKPTMTEVPLYVVAKPSNDAHSAASKIGGTVSLVSGTGSMRPMLQEGDFVVLLMKPIKSVKAGQVVSYVAPYNKNPIIHRVALVDSGGLLMSGDSAPNSESWFRVTESTYRGTLVGIYRPKK